MPGLQNFPRKQRKEIEANQRVRLEWGEGRENICACYVANTEHTFRQVALPLRKGPGKSRTGFPVRFPWRKLPSNRIRAWRSGEGNGEEVSSFHHKAVNSSERMREYGKGLGEEGSVGRS